jgi:regulatory protein
VAATAGERSDADRAREICVRLLTAGPRTRQELATALRQRGIPAEVAHDLLERYREVGMVDDRAFARAWVATRHHGKGLAGRALAGELRRKGVEADAIGAALDEIGGDVQARTARELVDRKLRSDHGGSADATLRRLVAMLARKGYPPGLAFRVVRDALTEAELSVEDTESLEAAMEAEAAQPDDEN